MLEAWLLIEDDADKERLLRGALSAPRERGTALRLLLLLSDAYKRAVFDVLVDQASVGHADIALVRIVISSLGRTWLTEHIEPIANRILDDENDEECYRRFAELYNDLDRDLLRRLVKKAAASNDPGIIEVAENFSKS
jgi:hypothetical protein